MVQRARLILMLDEGRTYAEVEQALGCSSPYITRWKRRFLESRIRGLASRYVGGRPRVRTAALEAKILEKTRTQPKDGSTHWSTRKLAAELGVSHMMVARVWARAGLQPHRLERYMASDDPDFERKAADIIGLYLNPPRHAAVFCLDEKSHIQALDRLDPVLPLSPGRAERHPQIHFHFTPTYSSWLNQVEIWFSKIERDVIARGVFTSAADLARKLMRYIRHYNKRAKPVRWTYRDTSRRITHDSAVTVH
jgi:transposase